MLTRQWKPFALCTVHDRLLRLFGNLMVNVVFFGRTGCDSNRTYDARALPCIVAWWAGKSESSLVLNICAPTPERNYHVKLDDEMWIFAADNSNRSGWRNSTVLEHFPISEDTGNARTLYSFRLGLKSWEIQSLLLTTNPPLVFVWVQTPVRDIGLWSFSRSHIRWWSSGLEEANKMQTGLFVWKI
jgi:hypothetical protein